MSESRGSKEIAGSPSTEASARCFFYWPRRHRSDDEGAPLAPRPDGIFISDFKPGEIGPELFRKACEFGLEGLVSKHGARAYRAGTSPNWVKVKNPKHPAMTRVMEAFSDRS
jgi:hypothetical protein